MNTKQHWEHVYQTKAADAVSWFRPHLEYSLSLIKKVAPDRNKSIIDIGGGESTSVDDLLGAGYADISVLDISQAAVDATRRRLAPLSDVVTWQVGDITQVDLSPASYDVWHDRAVFHFLTDGAQRKAYVRLLMNTVKPKGYVIMATFGPDGPMQCSAVA